MSSPTPSHTYYPYISPRPSFETNNTFDTTKSDALIDTTTQLVGTQPGPSNKSSKHKARKVWQSVKKAAKEHHRAVNSAYVLYYGGPQFQNPPPSWRDQARIKEEGQGERGLREGQAQGAEVESGLTQTQTQRDE
ncbi:hypothetical protein BCR34DRAFT_605525 [Clohesyomyces aquaticus]|uniref:Uncharacterized protein n=1 Tax=Clohesyomyces aquaticus TaxID=1231657 RepID=A0A1Y1YX08_9PLEO|nr:hypothetical protein BCR34DRAFT_605525 [Clohesyomyces aquaticus]